VTLQQDFEVCSGGRDVVAGLNFDLGLEPSASSAPSTATWRWSFSTAWKNSRNAPAAAALAL